MKNTQLYKPFPEATTLSVLPVAMIPLKYIAVEVDLCAVEPMPCT